MDMSNEKLKFLCEKVTQEDPNRNPNSPSDEAALDAYRKQAESVFCDFTLLRSAAVIHLDYEEWAEFLQRRWNQFIEAGGTFTPRGSNTGPKEKAWANFFGGTTFDGSGTKYGKVWVRWQVQMQPYCKKVVEVCKQKLRILATGASAADKVFVFVLDCCQFSSLATFVFVYFVCFFFLFPQALRLLL